MKSLRCARNVYPAIVSVKIKGKEGVAHFVYHLQGKNMRI